MDKRQFQALALVVVTVLGGACGDDDSDNGAAAGADAPTKEEYIAEADAICRSYLPKMEEVSAESEGLILSGEPDPAAVQAFLQKLYDLGAENFAEVRDLTLPEGDAGAEIDAVFGEAEAAFDGFKENLASPEAAMEYWNTEFQRLMSGEESAGSDPLAAIDEKMTDLGFQVCFSGGVE